MSIQHAKPRQDVLVSFEDGTLYSGPVGTTLEAFLRQWHTEHANRPEQQPIAAMVDNRLRELTYPLTRDVKVRPITISDADGSRIYRRTLSFILVVAIEECFPSQKVVIEHAIPSGGFFCQMLDRPNLTAQELAQVKAKMDEIIAADDPIVRENMPLDVAFDLFTQRQDFDKVRLLAVREQDYLTVYKLRGYIDYFYGYMAPSTGYITRYELSSFGNGFVLRYPRREVSTEIGPSFDSPKLIEVFNQTAEWLNLIGITDIGQLNEVVTGGEARIREMILMQEALHERKIAEIGNMAAQKHAEGIRIILIAGPSSSGKTTFAKRLAIQLLTHGIKPFTVEMDNYFVDRELTPRDENGDYDFETLEALNVELLNEHLHALIAGERVQLPKFDFKVGKSYPDRIVQISEQHMLILEGIHGMNPNLTPSFSQDETFKVYVSALTQLNIDRHNRVPTTDVRLLRRIVRDAKHRSYTAEDTLQRWPSVRRGEKRNIFFYQENADVMFNSALVYELSVLRPLAEPLLLRVNPDSPLRVEAHRLLSFLGWVRPMGSELIPDNSLLREFVGGSILRDYHPGT
ncbi:MAG: nucleoside kinase [Phototrophicales bacterium]|nr:MAG: nucleoside kinase [Phototrophicales bacterium]